jgi:hypothetical protein
MQLFWNFDQISVRPRILGVVITLLASSVTCLPATAIEPVDIGSRRELFVDDYLIEAMEGVQLRLHRPQMREVVMDYNMPWEGSTCCYQTVFQDGDIYRMYYRGTGMKNTYGTLVCYAESKDGIHWTRPDLDILELDGSSKNNIIWPRTLEEVVDNGTTYGIGSSNFAPFKDTNPNCSPDAQYKAFGQSRSTLAAFKSPDGIHWKPLRHIEPGEKFVGRYETISTDGNCPGWSAKSCRMAGHHTVLVDGEFDSLNIGFWDPVRGQYVAFIRDAGSGMEGNHYTKPGGYRTISTATSTDFVHWSKTRQLDFSPPKMIELYTNAIQVYHRAPHMFLGFPLRYLPARRQSDGHFSGWGEVTDVLFISSRDGVHFQRGQEAIIRPGLQLERWGGHCNNMVAAGIVETPSDVPGSPNELSVYSIENYYTQDSCQLRRYTWRLDGFASITAPMDGGELVTRPIRFTGKHLEINFSTSAAGSVRVEVQDENGVPFENFTLDDSADIYGDSINQVVSWGDSTDLSGLAGQPIRLRFMLRDADLYSFQFRQ